MRLTRSHFIIWDKAGGGNYVIISRGDGVFEKNEGFRSRQEAEEWVERCLRKARLEEMENALFAQPWLPAAQTNRAH